MIAGTGWGWDFFLIQRGWDGVEDKLCGNGWGWGSFGNPVQASSPDPTSRCVNVKDVV